MNSLGMTNMLRRVFAIAILAATLCTGCMRNSPSSEDSAGNLDSLKAMWDDFNRTGQYDSLIIHTIPHLQEAAEKGDTSKVLFCGIAVTMAHLSLENTDSVHKYLSFIEPYGHGDIDPGISQTLNYVLGTYSLKTGFNYPKALEHYQKCYEIAQSRGNINNQIVALGNMVQVYYIRKDRRGTTYAKTALKLADSPKANKQARAMALTAMAQMDFLNNDYIKALNHCSQARSLADEGGFASILPILDLVTADVYAVSGDRDKASEYYMEALRRSDIAEPGTASMIFLHYGKFCEDTRDYDRAIELYREGETISLRHGNMEFRRELYHRLSDLLYEHGDKEQSLEYYRKFTDFLDTVANQTKEYRFDSLLLANQQMKHNEELGKREIELLKARRNATVAALLSASILTILLLLIVLYRRQKNTYRLLFEKYQDYLQRTSRKEVSATDNREDKEKALFAQAESLMKDTKIYRHKDISVEKMAEILGTNRTYLSKAVNRFSGLSFPAYVNMYRIREATEIISDTSKDIVLKQLAESLGYSSVNVFHKAFQKETGLTPSRYRKELSVQQN